MINSSATLQKNFLRILIVDDSAIYRKTVRDVLTTLPGVQVVGTACDGREAIDRLPILQPDLLILDIDMPMMNGLEVLKALPLHPHAIGAIVLSGLAQESSEITVKALELGAFDFIQKPQTSSLSHSMTALSESLAPLIEAYRAKMPIQGRLSAQERVPLKSAINRISIEKPGTRRIRSAIVAIGISTGGPQALNIVIPQLPADLGVPVVIAQHMPSGFTFDLAKRLNGRSALTVKEAESGEKLMANTVYIGPGGNQMRIVAGKRIGETIVEINTDSVEGGYRPSADYLFTSVAEQYLSRATGVIMTGMGNDGTQGLRFLKEKGGRIIAQDEKTSVVYGMPRWPREAGLVDVEAPLDQIAEEICRTVR
ncbi:MAG: chemotaxis-specific protein-glutamate methyltransferase CheB [Proteobacteria bacterium]|nr:chemotaxis-specific protein-glutamate methyltransferase CheB [Pseudomonadota bacterium]MBU1688264.1 chemotaxis-specific protein-glutamate methyltransferase CheB [Pseudomonadota bacterium]